MATPFELGACVYPPMFVAGVLSHELTPLEDRGLHVAERALQAEPLHPLTTSVLIDGRLFVTCTGCGWTRELFTKDVPQVCGVEQSIRDARRRVEKAIAEVHRVVVAGEREAEHLAARLRELAS